jgi:hypothetical protein
MLDEIADELKTAREKNSMTLVQVANKSKIDIKFLEAMEQGDFAFLPELYVRAFVKNFAKSVGLDETKIIKKFEAAKQGIPYIEDELPPEPKIKLVETVKKENPPAALKEKPIVQKTKPEIQNKDSLFTYDAVGANNPSQESENAAKKRNLILGGALLAVILLFTVVYFFLFNKSDQIIVAEKPIEEVIEQNQRYLEEEQPADQTENLSYAADSLILNISAVDTSWIKVSLDKRSFDEFILLPNSQKSLKAKTNFNITLGNSGGIILILNNKKLSFTGKNKAPLSLIIDKDGLKYSGNSSN